MALQPTMQSPFIVPSSLSESSSGEMTKQPLPPHLSKSGKSHLFYIKKFQ